MTDRQDIMKAIAALEAQRVALGNAVTETTLVALRQQLANLNHQEVPTSALRGERRQVTVMFADISGFTAMSEKLDPEEVRSLINACFERLGQAIDRFGGHIDKFIGDEIMALFGAPAAHENDPERALRAALEMMAVLEEFNREHQDRIAHPLALHFGLNTGLVIAGGIGTRQRQDYSVMGDTVNLAARLEDLSEAGEILIGEDTYRLTAPLFEFEVLKPVKVKGKAQPVRIYRLLGAKAVPGGQIRGIEGMTSPLVGRVEELGQLNQILNGVCDGRGGVVSVVGEVGLGKSRLVDEVCLTCRLDSTADWFEGRALSYGENASYLVARGVLRSILGLGPETSSAEAELALRTELERCVPDQIAEIYPYLAHILDIHLDEESAKRIKYLEGEALHQQISQSVHNYILARTNQTPLILVWEDLHWADPSSLSLLEVLIPATQACALLLILIYRPRLYSRAWAFHQKIGELAGDTHKIIELSPLTSEESGQLLDNLLGPDALPATVRQLIVSKAEGNPFYLEEVIRSLINSNAITP
ncbi:MAG: AAA family ATPase, partial [Anaerolineae bacterium]|nr:AAA family ATPase [Anaerolineae bacterium]